MSDRGGLGGSLELRAPPMRRRLAAFIYEGLLVFGVLVISGYLYSSLTQQRHALQGLHGLQLFEFCVLGLYFSWFWCHGGQTVAMKTWHIRLVSAQGGPVSAKQAVLRYVLCWVWFLPALAVLGWSGPLSGLQTVLALSSGIIAYAGLALRRQDKQFLHDVVAGTRLLDVRPRATDTAV
ncbi:MAG: hypothetical protein RI949_2027 [Pseudomonadota bacterium]|jgi:uncharacterized RDD family membrane protein YckC|nr:RDD family protein [Betaproteobacteria bacterium]